MNLFPKKYTPILNNFFFLSLWLLTVLLIFEAKQCRPGWFKPYECLAEILLAQGKYAGATINYRKAVKLVNDTEKDILNNLEGDNLSKRIKFYEAQIEKCEIYKGNPDGVNETEDEVKYRQ